jgi:hypothetical protein
MDYWSRAPLSVSMRESLLREIEGFATRERKKSREIVELILEWSVARLQEAGSVNRLLCCRIRLPEGPAPGLRTSRKAL